MILIPKLRNLDSCYPTLCGGDHVENVSLVKPSDGHSNRRSAAGGSRVTMRPVDNEDNSDFVTKLTWHRDPIIEEELVVGGLDNARLYSPADALSGWLKVCT